MGAPINDSPRLNRNLALQTQVEALYTGLAQAWALIRRQEAVLEAMRTGIPERLKNITNWELQQLGNMGRVEISAAQWAYLAALGEQAGDLKTLSVDAVSAIGANAVTGERGFLTRMINRTGGVSVKGTLVSLSTTANSEIVLQANEYDSVGVVAQAGIAAGAEVWVWKNGSTCQVLYEDGVAATRGNILLAAATDGRARDVANPGSGLPAVDVHFKECGHVNESKTAGTDVLALCDIHFN